MAMLIVEADPGAVAVASAEALTASVERATARSGQALVSLTGGETPRRMYALLCDNTYPWRGRIDWASVDWFWGDERHVPPHHPESNYGMAHDTLFGHVPVDPSRLHRMHGEYADPHVAAHEYDLELRRVFAAAGRLDLTFDLMLLGIGEDAHIASIFPGSDLLASADPPVPSAPSSTRQNDASGVSVSAKRTAAVWADHLNAWRVTLTPAALLDARETLVVAAGDAKAAAIRAALEEPLDIRRRPAQLLRAAGDRVTWIVDRAAAAYLRR